MKWPDYIDIYDFLKEKVVKRGRKKFGHKLFSFYKLEHAKMQKDAEEGHAKNKKYKDIKKETKYSLRQISRIKNKRIGITAKRRIKKKKK